MPALLGTLLIATSPFSIVMAGEYMMHGAVFGLLACGLACVVYSFDRGSLSTSVLGGALLCLAATMRQATVVAILIPWALTLVLWWRQKIVSLQSAAVVGGALIMGALFVIDCKAITGSYLLLPHTHLHGLGLTVENLRAGADHVDSMVGWHLAPMILSLPANGWTVSLVGAGLWVTPRRFLVALLGPLLMLVVTHLFVSVHGLHGYGARFLYEASPALLVLIGLFFCALLSAAQERSSVLIALGYLAVFAANGWSLATILPTYRNYNALSSELASAICNISSQRAVVVLPSGSWQATDVAAACYDPTYSKRVYIQSDERYNWRAALRFFEEWDIYRVEGNKVVSLDASQEF
jgi:4-amino-4-deoxy-L-arabinose transferase-like glycosyltransferase